MIYRTPFPVFHPASPTKYTTLSALLAPVFRAVLRHDLPDSFYGLPWVMDRKPKKCIAKLPHAPAYISIIIVQTGQ